MALLKGGGVRCQGYSLGYDGATAFENQVAEIADAAVDPPSGPLPLGQERDLDIHVLQDILGGSRFPEIQRHMPNSFGAVRS